MQIDWRQLIQAVSSVDLIQTRGLTFHQQAADVCDRTDVFLLSFVLKLNGERPCLTLLRGSVTPMFVTMLMPPE